MGSISRWLIVFGLLAALGRPTLALAETASGASARGLSVVESDGALVVLRVESGSSAARAGLRVGDRISAVDGAEVTSTGALDAALEVRGPTRLRVSSGGVQREVVLEAPASAAPPPNASSPATQTTEASGPPPHASSPAAPTTAAPPPAATPQATVAAPTLLGVTMREARGLEIVSVLAGSPAQKAGLEPGDRIVSVNGQVVAKKAAILEALARLGPGDVVEVNVTRSSGPSAHRVTLEARDPRLPPAGAVISQETNSVSPELGKELGLSYSESRVTRVFDPVDLAHLFNWSFTVNANFASSGNSAMSGATLGYRYLDPLGVFPAGESGGASCFSLELNLGALGGAIEMEPITIPAVPGVSGAQTFGGGPTGLFFARATLVPTYTFLYFGDPSADGLQSGLGFKIGAEVGGSLSVINLPFGGTSTDFSPVVGPALGLELPNYNPGTAELALFSATVVVIPISGVSVTASVGGAF